MKKYINRFSILTTICIMGGSLVQAQAVYKISTSKENAMKLSGTSTLHKWDMNAKDFSSQAQFGFKAGTTQVNVLTALTFSLTVHNLKSNSRGLDDNAYKALKTDQYKNISYKLISATVPTQGGNSSLIKTKGNLTIAGITKPITMDVSCTVNADATVTCKGSDKLNMTDYQVKPPTFMAGAMKTGDAITLDFTMVYNK